MMEGVTTAIVLFIFFCIAYPQHIKNRPQFYSALGIVCLIILLQAFAFALIGHGVVVFLTFAAAVMQIFAILLLFMAAGGLSWADLRDDVGHAYEVIRRGGEEKEIIVPLSGEMARRPANAAAKPAGRSGDERPEAIRIEAPKPISPSEISLPLEE